VAQAALKSFGIYTRYIEEGKTNMKKIYAIALAAAMILALLPATAFAAGTTVTTAAELTSALDTGGEFELGADIDAGDLVQGSFFTVNSGKTVTLDLNGHTLEGTRIDGTISSGNRNTSVITNKGTLTIKDSAGGGKIVIDATNEDSWNSATAAVSNSGTLTVESGTLQNLGGTSMAYALDNLSNGSSIYAYLTVNGGTIRSENYIGLRLFANSTAADFCTATINGGTIYGYKRGIWIQQPSSGVNGEAVLTISGGKIEAQTQSAIMADLLGTDGIDIAISGGELVNHSDTHATLTMMLGTNPSAGGGYAVITGGTLLNTGSAGNLVAEGAESVIAVYKGTFNVVVPSEFIVTGVDPDDIVIGGNSEVTADADITYMIVITPSVDFGTISRDMSTQTKDFVVAVVDALIEDGATISVKNTTADMTMKDKDGSGSESLAFALARGLFTFTQADLADGEASITSSVSCEPSQLQAAGSYKGYMTFKVSYVQQPS
jgi:hypothetical protein